MAGARTFEQLDAWKLSAQLRDLILDLTQQETFRDDWDFRAQIRDASSSAPRNLAEGFGAFNPREFARFTRIARRSLMETRNHVLDGHRRGYFTATTAGDLLTLCGRALGATTALLKYLEACDGTPPAGWTAPKRRR